MSFLLDRFITLRMVQPCHRVLKRLRAQSHQSPAHRRLPILMYHSISNDAASGGTAYYRTKTSPRRFTEQMRFLKDNGYRALTLRDGVNLLNDWQRHEGGADSTLPTGPSVKGQTSDINHRYVALTFDDGFRDFYTTAFPILQEFGFDATMFLPTNFVNNNGAPRQFLGLDCLTWLEVRELKRFGIELGSHSVTHPKLVDLSWSKIESELSDSKSEIEQHLGSAVDSFAYPYAFPQSNVSFTRRLSEVLQQLGYHCCVTTEIGSARSRHNPFRLPRLPLNDADDLALFAAKLDGAYDWLAWPQRAVKSFTSALHR
jgi:peptidoglycan/xylan/chitin deacetylase (PgdA/CDA1 family)